MSNLVGIPADMLTDAWPVVEPYIVKVCDASRGRFTPADFGKAISARDMQLWAEQELSGSIRAIGVTRIVKYPQMKVSEFIACVGEGMESWKEHMTQIEEWARGQGCEQAHLFARTGWARIMKSQGYEHTHSILEKSLCP